MEKFEKVREKHINTNHGHKRQEKFDDEVRERLTKIRRELLEKTVASANHGEFTELNIH